MSAAKEKVIDSTPQPEVGDAYDYNRHHDAVFGDLSEDGPNYRNVKILSYTAVIYSSPS